VPRSLVSFTLICLAAASAAQGQPQDGRGRRGGGGSETSGGSPGFTPPPAHVRPPTPLNESEIVGVVKAIDPAAGRITIAYEAIAARNWPPGVMPFTTYKSAVLKDVTVGEKVRFKLDGQQITEIAPY
jgi:hypothetical protein